METLRDNKFVITFFLVLDVECLGYFISNEGARVDWCKIEAVIKCPIKGNMMELRGFFRLGVYHPIFWVGAVPSKNLPKDRRGGESTIPAN